MKHLLIYIGYIFKCGKLIVYYILHEENRSKINASTIKTGKKGFDKYQNTEKKQRKNQEQKIVENWINNEKKEGISVKSMK